jgi:flagellar biosynthesis GTPase FlhF
MPKKPMPLLIGIDVVKMLAMVRNVLGAIFVKLFRYVRVRVKNFHITVASEDAATTAMLYGVICGYGDAIMAILEKALDFKIEKGAKVGADCDYLSDEMKMDVEVDVSISIGNVFRYIFGIVGSALGGALRGLKLRLNKKYFSQKKQYKKDLAEYKVMKAERDAKDAEKAAKAEEKAAKKAAKAEEKAAKKAAKEAEAAGAAEPENTAEAENEENNNIENNNDLMTEASERENNYEQQE